MNPPSLYLLCGLPGAGKTTRSRRIARATGALELCADRWLLALGVSLVDYDFRPRLQDALLAHAEELWQRGVSVVIEFGSWHRAERKAIRSAAARRGVRAELHCLDAPVDELKRRVRARGGLDAEALATNVLGENAWRFEPPTGEEIAEFDVYFGPDDAWSPG